MWIEGVQGGVAQRLEQRLHKPCVVGSSPTLAIAAVCITWKLLRRCRRTSNAVFIVLGICLLIPFVFRWQCGTAV